MHGNLEPDEKVLSPNEWLRFDFKLSDLGWEPEDEIVVKIGGVVVSGIHQPDDANPKWTLPYGEHRFNKESFIVIQNESRRETVGSQPLPDNILRERFLEDGCGQLYAKRELEELREPSAVASPSSEGGLGPTQGEGCSLPGAEGNSK